MEQSDQVLVQVWGYDASVGFGDHIADLLQARGVPDACARRSVRLVGGVSAPE